MEIAVRALSREPPDISWRYTALLWWRRSRIARLVASRTMERTTLSTEDSRAAL
jgi:hypothetical protein